MHSFGKFMKRQLNTTKKIFQIINENKTYLFIILLVTLIFLFGFMLEINSNEANGYLDQQFWMENLVPNIMADMIGIVFTSFIIAGLFSSHNKKRDSKMVYSLLGHDFEILNSILSRNLLYLLKRDESYLSFQKSDKEVLKELRKSQKDVETFLNISALSSSFRVWNVTESSPLIDVYIIRIAKIEKYIKQFEILENDINNLRERKEKIALYLTLSGNDSGEYQELSAELNEIEALLKSKSKLFAQFPINNDLLNVETRENLNAFQLFYKGTIEQFNNKYNYLIPIEIRYTLAELQSNIYLFTKSIEDYHFPNRFGGSVLPNIEEFREKKKKDSIRALVSISEEILNLSKHFNTIK